MSLPSINCDLFGIGIGPFNLSIAALASKLSIKACFSDIYKSMSWHPGLMLNEAKMQTSPLKDMVTTVDPTHPLSFLNYLVCKKRIYAFIASQMTTISRQEFADYLSWVASKLEGLYFDNKVKSVDFKDNKFVIETQKSIFYSQHLCLGTGKQPYIPECALAHVNKNCFHASRLLEQKHNYTGKKIAIIGGGQTGADVFLNFLKRNFGDPAQVHWVSRRPNFQMLDEGVFTDQYFTPQYGQLFYDLPPSTKSHELKHQKLSSDGITAQSLLAIYHSLYQETFINGNSKQWDLRPNRTLNLIKKNKQGFSLTLANNLVNTIEFLDVDVIILCTGFESKVPDYLAPLSEKFPLTDSHGEFNLTKNFAVKWPHDNKNHIYAVNAGLHSHGIIDPQLSLTAWRSATILNAILGYNHFNLNTEHSIINWQTPKTPQLNIQKGKTRVNL